MQVRVQESVLGARGGMLAGSACVGAHTAAVGVALTHPVLETLKISDQTAQSALQVMR